MLYGGTSPHAGMNRVMSVWYDMNGDGDTADSGDYLVDLDYDANGNMTERDVTYAYGGGANEAWDYSYEEDDRVEQNENVIHRIVSFSKPVRLRRPTLKHRGNADVMANRSWQHWEFCPNRRK